MRTNNSAVNLYGLFSEAYQWLCRSRRNHPPSSDIWSFRLDWKDWMSAYHRSMVVVLGSRTVIGNRPSALTDDRHDQQAHKFSYLFSKHLLPHRTSLGADSAVVTAVKFMKIVFFVAIAGPGIQHNIPFHAWTPTAPFQSFRRASFNAFGTFTTQAFLYGFGGFEGCVGQYSTQTHPGAPGLS